MSGSRENLVVMGGVHPGEEDEVTTEKVGWWNKQGMPEDPRGLRRKGPVRSASVVGSGKRVKKSGWHGLSPFCIRGCMGKQLGIPAMAGRELCARESYEFVRGLGDRRRR